LTQPWCLTVDAQGRATRDEGVAGRRGGRQGVAWTSAASEADLHELRAWRAAVGPAWLAEGGDASETGPPLVAVAWNARTGGGALRAFWRRLLDERGGSGGPVAALLQEVFTAGDHVPPVEEAAAPAEPSEPSASAELAVDGDGPARRWSWAERIADRPPGEDRTDVVAFAREEGLSLVYVPSMRNGVRRVDDGDGTREAEAEPVQEDRGNAIVANVPLTSPLAVELPFERQRRVAVAAQVEIGGERVGLCSVHLDNRAPWRRAWRSLGRARARQMAGLLRALTMLGWLRPLKEDGMLPVGVSAFGAPWAPVQSPRIFALGGDFNTWTLGRREAAYKLARRRFPHPHAPDPRPTHHFEVGGFLRRSDHLLFALPEGWHGDCRRLDDAFGSDHYPLVGTLRRS